MQQLNLKKTFLIGLIASLSISALIGIGIFLFGSFDELQFRILATTLAIGIFSLIGLAESAIIKKYATFVSISLGISALAFLFSIWEIWNFTFFGDETTGKLTADLIIISFSLAHVSLLLLLNIKTKTVDTIFFFTVLFIALVALMIIFMIHTGSQFGDFYYRLLGIFAILDVLGTITTPLLNKIVKE